MITDKDIQKLKTVFATKDDLKNFATKDDLEKLDIRTGEGFVAVKNQFDNLEHRFDNLENRFDNLENQFKELKNEVISMEDHIIKELKSMQLDQKVSLSHKREISDHETRITKIEHKLQLA